MAVDLVALEALRLLAEARKQNPLEGWLPERVLFEALCPCAGAPVGAVSYAQIAAEREAFGAALGGLLDLGAVACRDGGYRLTRVGVVALAVAEAWERDRLRRRGGS